MRITETPTQLLIKNKLTTLLLSFVLINPALLQILPTSTYIKQEEEKRVDAEITELKTNVLAILQEDGQRDISHKGFDEVFNILVEKVDKESLVELIPVAYCESSFNQGGQNTNKDNSKDNGIFQINSKYHSGVDVSTIEKNVDYAVKLYKANSLNDWRASKYCWQPVVSKMKSTLI